MILSIIIIVLIGGITYWHYSQGFFSALFSAVSALIAAVLAVSYHEPIVAALLGGKIADYADGLFLVAIFALVYIVLRTIFDNMVPGNARLPVYLDRIGGAAMGLVAACYAAGIFALAAQMLPFGPSVGGYVRYDTEDRDVSIQVTGGRGQNSDVPIENQLKEDRLEGGKKSLIVPVDDLLLATVQKLSDGGSLAGDRPLASIHPDYADELFAQRLGVQIGAKKTAVNLATGRPQVSLPDKGAVFEFTQDINKSQIDGEVPQIHQRPVTVKKPTPPEDFPLVVRLMFNHDASDQDGNVRLGPGSVRLVADGTNYWPVGTIEHGTTLYANKLDDHLLINVKDADKGADFLFFVDPHKVVDGDPKAKTDRKVKEGVFIEAKRLAKVDLGGQDIRAGVTPSKNVEVVRKQAVVDKDKKSPKPGAEGGDAAAVDPSKAPMTVSGVQVNEKLFTPINVGTPDANASNAQIKSGIISLKDKKFTKLKIEPTESISMMAKGDFALDDLFVPQGFKLVQITGAPPEEGGDAWAWADNVGKFLLVDANNKSYKPAGAWARVKDKQTDRLAASYDSSGTVLPSISHSEGRPTDVYIAFLVPSGTTLKNLKYGNAVVHETSETVQ